MQHDHHWLLRPRHSVSLLTNRIALLLLLCGSAGLAEQTNVTSNRAGTNAIPATIEGITAEAQWRPNSSGRYPLLEVYYTNKSGKSVELKKPRLNNMEIGHLTNGVIWTDFYPSEKLEPGQSIALVMCLAGWSQKIKESEPQTITVETQDEQTIVTKSRPFSTPGPIETPERRITGVTFSRQFDRVFVTYAPRYNVGKEEAPPKVMVNGKDCTAQAKILQLPRYHEDSGAQECGILMARLPSPTGPGRPIHIRLSFADGEIAQDILRASWGIFLNSFNVGEKDEKLRRQLNLDLKPAARNIGTDLACSDTRSKNTYGKTASQILAVRRKWYQEFPEILSYDYLCTVATGIAHYPIYVRIADGIMVNPYELGFYKNPKFIEEEEIYFEWARQMARLWYWIPESYCTQQSGRMLEPDELWLLAMAALGNGCKGLEYYSYVEALPLIGYSQSPVLLKAITALNAEIQNLQPLLAASIHLSTTTIGDPKTGYRVYTLWTPDASSDGDLAVIVRNLDYQTDRQPNDLGAKPRCKVTSKKNLRVSVARPSWLVAQMASDALTKQPLTFKQLDDTIEIEIGQLDLGKIIWIKNANKEFKHEAAKSS